MYRNLEAEMVKVGLSKRELAEMINMPYSTLADKLSGRTGLWLEEAILIRKTAFPNFSTEYLFEVKEKAMA